VIIVQSHLIQGKEAAVTFKISILDGPYNSFNTRFFFSFSFSFFISNWPNLWKIGTCFLIKGGKNSNKADAQGES
jgi:hypothetical protein